AAMNAKGLPTFRQRHRVRALLQEPARLAKPPSGKRDSASTLESIAVRTGRVAGLKRQLCLLDNEASIYIAKPLREISAVIKILDALTHAHAIRSWIAQRYVVNFRVFEYR
ncbi:MAG: hypothetical protein ABIR56_07130, partial [Polaromonas sp.]